MTIIQAADLSDLAQLAQAIGAFDSKLPHPLGIWSIADPYHYIQGYWHIDWMFGDDGKAYFVEV